MSYSTIKKIIASQVLKCVSTYVYWHDLLSLVLSSISSLIYQLSELLGMSRWYDKFGILGLSADDVEGWCGILADFCNSIVCHL